MKTLFELYREHQGKVSDKWSIYLSDYDRIFSSYREKPITMLEIGIQNGGSLEIWSKYFKSAIAFVGCDINPDCAFLTYDDTRINVVVGDANTDKTQEAILGHAEGFDLIIDDGSHTSSDIIKSFARYFRRLNEGGTFVAEDLHCSYWDDFEGGLYYPYSSIAFFKRLADVINHEHWGVEKTRKELLQGFSETFAVQFDEHDLAQIHSVEIFNSVCVIHKSPAKSNVLGERFVAGQNEYVIPGHHGLSGGTLIAPGQYDNPWATMDIAPEENWEELSRALSDRDERVADLETQVAALRNSTSWRLTAPLRSAVSLLKRAKRLLKVALAALKRHGGISGAARKFISFYRREGFSGVMRVIRMVQTAGRVRPAAGSGSYDRNDYAEWVRRYDTINDAKRAALKGLSDRLTYAPKISVVMPTYNPSPEWLTSAIESVRSQIYPNWELCIADDASTDASIRPILERFSSLDERIKVTYRDQNGHISAASNSALELVTGEWVALLDHDDLLTEHALVLVAKAINEHRDAGLIYSDEDKVDELGNRSTPYFKCAWNLNLFRSQNMICHLATYRTDLIKQVGGFRVGFEGSQDYDLALRIVELLDDKQIIHIPYVLYHWRMHADSTALDSGTKTYAQTAGVKALQEHLQRNTIKATAELTPFFQYRIRYSLPASPPKVSLIIPTRNSLNLVRQCIASILGKTTYSNYDVLIVDNGSDDPEVIKYFDSLASDSRVKVVRDDRPFNYASLNNDAVALADGEYVCLLNNDVEVITADWLEEMVGLAVQKGSGAIGACLWYPDNSLQHAGVLTGIGGVAGHAHKLVPRGAEGYFNRARLVQGMSAVTGACLLVKKSIYEEVGGLNSVDLAIAFNDVDFCLKIQSAGYQNIWTPFAELYHHESASRGTENTPEKVSRFNREVSYMKRTWGSALLDDPAYNKNLTLDSEDFSLAWPPRTSRF